jgi:hypothetical protein
LRRPDALQVGDALPERCITHLAIAELADDLAQMERMA